MVIVTYSCIASIVGVASCLYALRKYRESKWGVCSSKKSLNGKIVVITGANSGIGKETAKELATRGAVVILACRNKDAANKAVHSIRSYTKSGELIIVNLDLGDLSSVKKCAEDILNKFSKIDILINNAGVSYPPKPSLETKQGFEIHFGVNHLGHFLFTSLLLQRIKETPSSRIIIVSSGLHQYGKVDIDRITKTQDTIRKGRNVLYSDSKLCNVLHAHELSRRLQGTTTGVHAVCPGFVYTGLFRYTLKQTSWINIVAFLPIAFLFMRNSKQGSQCSVHCAVSEELDNVPFAYLRDCKLATPSEKSQDPKLALDLWDLSTNLVKTYF